MTVDRPLLINENGGSHTNDPLGVALVGSPTTANKANGGIPLSNQGCQFVIGNGTEEGGTYEYDATPTAHDYVADEKLIIYIIQWNAPNRIEMNTIANDGGTFRLQTGTGADYRIFPIAGNDTLFGKFASSPKVVVIDPVKQGDLIRDVGTYDPTSVLRYSFVCNSLDQGGSTCLIIPCNVYHVDHVKAAPDIPKIYGTSVQMKDFHDDNFGTDFTDTFSLSSDELSDGIYNYSLPIQIGKASETTTGDDLAPDGSNATYFSPSNALTSDPRFYITNKAMRVYFVQGTALTWDLTALYSWGTRADWEIESGVIWRPSGAFFTGMGLFKIDSGSMVGNATYNNVDAVQVSNNGADLDGSLFTNSFADSIKFGFQDDGGVFTDDTTDCRDIGSADVQIFEDSAPSNDAFYFGMDKEFAQLQLEVNTANSGGTFVWEYWDGTAWVDLSETGQGIDSTGVNEVTWTPVFDWTETDVDGQSAFWVRVRVTGTITTGAVIDHVSCGLNRAGALVLDFTPSSYTLEGCTFSGNAFDIEITTAGTYTLDNCGTIGRIRNTSEGAVTINLSGGTSITNTESIGAGSITTVNTVTLTVNCKDSSDDSNIENVQVHILQASDTSIVLASGTTNASGDFIDSTFNYTGDLAVVIRARKGTATPFYVPDSADNTITVNGLSQNFSLDPDSNNAN